MSLKIKVCGMRNPNNIKALAQLKPDFMGFIFYDKSPRLVTKENNLETILALPKTIKKVGVFVNESLQNIVEIAKKYQLDFVQLHGHENVEMCFDIKKAGIGVIKVFSVNNDFDFAETQKFENAADYFLFDTKGTSGYGGHGTAFDWSILNRYNQKVPFLLAGGVSLENISEIKNLKNLNLACVDVNSKFEISAGLKDIELLKKLFNYKIMSAFAVDERGYYGNFGGAFIPEMLFPNIEELQLNYENIINSDEFKAEFNQLLKDYVGRPTPLFFAERLSNKYGAKIYLKREDLCHTGAHKVNNTIGQILLAKKLGKHKIVAETGAGQHGVATATVCALMGMECIVYMGEIDIERQAPNVARMKMLGAEVRPAKSGSKTLKDATNEAMRHWINNPTDTHYIIGSVVGPHPYPDMVAKFQSVISKEIRWQLKEQTGSELPNYVIACVGGGSNAAGAYFHFLDEPSVKIIAAEAAGLGVNSGKSAATTFLGKEGILHGSKSLLMQTFDGQVVEPHSISAGLDYPGIGPLHAHLFQTKRATFYGITDQESIDSGFELTKLEGIIPAIESAHALAVLKYLPLNPTDVVVIGLSGRGDKDLATYMKYL